MAHLIFIAHLPLIRMTRQEDFELGPGVLTKLPWEQFDGLCQGAFSSWQRKYVGADPVFYWFQEEGDFPFVREGGADSMQELKLPTSAWASMLSGLGHGLIEGLHQQLVDPVWAALALAAPTGVPAPPRCSLTFLLPAGNASLEIAGRPMKGVRVQGDADHELAYLGDAASAPLSDDDLARVAAFVPMARWALADETLSPVLRRLLMCGDITLTQVERMLLAVTAAEDLLLPDVATESGDRFARRLSNLLGHDDAHRTAIKALARDLYRLRSAVMHSDDQGDERVRTDFPPGAAEQILAGTIEAACHALHGGTDIERLRQDLDAGPALVHPSLRVPLAPPPGQGQAYRLGPRQPWFSATFSSSASLAPPEGAMASWSPLVGLSLETDELRHLELGVRMAMVPAAALVNMEEKDIRRDFIAKTRMAGPVATLEVLAPAIEGVLDETDVLPLTRVRDLAVVGLRLAGYPAFIDPELAGWYVYVGHMRHRRETVLRQSVIMAIEGAVAAPLTNERRADVEAIWSLLARYEREAPDPELDRALDLYRRVHDRLFLPAATRAHLAWICVEALLGRFRSPTGTIRLETLVSLLDGVPPATAAWFQMHARAFRNAVAHREWTPGIMRPPEIWQADHEPLAHVLNVAGAALRAVLTAWVEVDPPVRARYGPSRLLVRRLSKSLT
jgi:hypothetical protein